MPIALNPITPIPPLNPITPVANITPFTYRDNYTYLRLLTGLREYITKVLVPQIDMGNDYLVEVLDGLLAEQAAAVNKTVEEMVEYVDLNTAESKAYVDTAVADLTTYVNTQTAESKQYVDDAVDTIINSTIAVTDPVMLALINDTNTNSRKKLDDLYDRGTVRVNNTADIGPAIDTALATGRTIVFDANETFTITSTIDKVLPENAKLNINLNGSTLDFKSGATLRIAPPFSGAEPVPYRTAVVPSGVVKNATSFAVADSTGVARGDLVTISSPVLLVAGINLLQTYVVGDIDGSTIYVDGIIVGDITPAQITAAAITGDVTAKFYKVAESVSFKNGVITSSDRSSYDTLVTIAGARKVDIEKMKISQPNRIGFSLQFNGYNNVSDIEVLDSGYVTKDQGYANDPASPAGQSYGYGVLSSRCYSVFIDRMQSRDGWHGVDFSRGDTLCVVSNSIFHKDAYGISAHELAWQLNVIGCVFEGGAGVTSRAMELNVIGSTFTMAIGNAISGNGSHQMLTLKGNVFKMGASGSTPFYFSAAYPDFCYSAVDSVSEISDNTIIDYSSLARVETRGVVKFLRNTVRPRAGVNAYVQFYINKTGQKKVYIIDNVCDGIGLATIFNATDLEEVHAFGNKKFGPLSASGNSVMFSIQGSIPILNFVDNWAENLVALVRTYTGVYGIQQMSRNVIKGGKLGLWAGTTTIANQINNQYGSTSAGATVSQDSGGLILT